MFGEYIFMLYTVNDSYYELESIPKYKIIKFENSQEYNYKLFLLDKKLNTDIFNNNKYIRIKLANYQPIKKHSFNNVNINTSLVDKLNTARKFIKYK